MIDREPVFNLLTQKVKLTEIAKQLGISLASVYTIQKEFKRLKKRKYTKTKNPSRNYLQTVELSELKL
jgi:hypothetical protein